jgi:hypothetical protein
MLLWNTATYNTHKPWFTANKGWTDLKEVDCEDDGTGLVSNPMVGFGNSCAEPSSSSTWELVLLFVYETTEYLMQQHTENAKKTVW